MHLKNRRALETFIRKYLHLAACRHSSTPPPSSSPQSTNDNKQRTMRVHRRISPYSHSDVSSLLIFYLCLDYNQLSASYRRCASPLSSSSSPLRFFKHLTSCLKSKKALMQWRFLGSGFVKVDVAVLHSWWWSALVISDLNLQPDRVHEREDLHLECSLRSSSPCPSYFLCPELIWSLIFEAGWRLWTMWGSSARFPLPLCHSLPYLLQALICRNFELGAVIMFLCVNTTIQITERAMKGYDECMLLFLSVHLTNHTSRLVSDIKPSITKATSFTSVVRRWYVNNMKQGYCWELTWGNMALSNCRSLLSNGCVITFFIDKK